MVATPQETQALAKRLASHLEAGDVLLLDGELGAGKTYFASALIHALGVPEHVSVTSPTFTLMHHYTGRLPIYHADTYRLEQPEELFSLGLEDAFEQEAVIVVEWGSRIVPWLRGPWLGMAFEFLEDTARTVRFSYQGDRAKTLAHLAAGQRV